MIAIFKKEIKTYFNSMIGWLFLAANLFFSGWYFKYYSLNAGYPYVSYVITGVMIIYLFSMPLLSMKIFSDEFKQKTDQLLFTAPISVWKIVLGKYLAMIFVFTIPVLVMCLYPLILGIYGNIPVAENYSALLGFLLFGFATLAVGLFISSLTDNQIIAGIITFFILLFMEMTPGICNLISPNGNIITEFLEIFDIGSYLDYFLNGIFYLPAFVYFFTIIFVCIFLTGYFLLRKRWTITQTGPLKLVGNLLGLIFVLIFILAFNVFLRTIPEQYLTKDLTYNDIYSLTNKAKDYLDNLEKDLTIYYIIDKSNKDEIIERTLNDISDYSKHITLEYVSAKDNPGFISDYTDENLPANSVIIVCDKSSKVLTYYDFFEIEYNYEYNLETGNYVATDYTVNGYDGEGRVLSGIDYVTSSEETYIYCITGHDELEIQEGLNARFEKANLNFEYINLLTYQTIPDNVACLLILGPLRDFTLEEVNKIREYMNNGGALVALVAYTDSEELTNYYSLLEDFNIKVCPGLVMEQGSSYYNSQSYYLLPDVLNTDITENVYSNLRTKYIYMPYCKGLLLNDENSDVYNQALLQTTEGAYLLTDNEKNKETGRFLLGIYSEKEDSRMVVYSSDYFLYEDIDSAVNGNNYDVFMKSLLKVIGEEEQEIIPSKNYSYDMILVDEFASNIISIIVIFIIPMAFVSAGIAIVSKRRRL